jgi:DnaA family protein
VNVPQLPLALRYPPDQRFENYLAAPAALIPQLVAIAAGQARDWMYLAGAEGSGKTHLALGLCAAAEQTGRAAAYVSLKLVAGRLCEALEALEGGAVVALDGLQEVVGNREQEVALFDFHNRARAAGVTVLYTAREMPDGLSLALPDLRSRLSQCIRFSLPILDDAGRAALLRDRAQRRGLVLEEAAIEWLLAHTERDVAGLMALLDRLDRESLAAKRRVTVPFLRRVLDEWQA